MIFPSLWEELISNYLWYCKKAKNAYKERVVVPVSRKLKDVLVSQSQEEAHQEIYDEIRILEEKFNEGGGRDQELWTKIAELKSLL